ncbi:Carboxypeptidase regulatory-like domain protein [Candidatus Norongarragalina meridionalis]|nr:Carboxypeptidase regulatory-like domain protein [Candidatus Norongarragalina meridionalis]
MGMGESLKNFYMSIEDKYYAFMEFMETKVHIPLERFFVAPIESRGIPSFPIFVLLLLAIFGGAYWFMFAGAPSGNLRIKVMSDQSDMLDGATVQIYADDVLVASNVTGADGYAEFANLASDKTLTIKITKDGYELVEKRLSVRDRNSLTVTMLCTSEECGATPTETPTETPTNEGDWTVPPAEETLNAKLVVLARDAKDSNVLISGTATVYDADTSVELATITITGGTGVAEGLEADMNVYVNIQADGYVPYDGSSNPLVLAPGSNTLPPAFLTKAGAGTSSGTTITVKDATSGLPLGGAAVQIFAPGGSAPIATAETDSAGSAPIELASGSYYARATKGGYFTGFSVPFLAGESVSVQLTLATPDTSTDLQVSIVDEEDGSAVSEANVAVYTADGKLLADTQTTSTEGKVLFPMLQRGATVSVRAVKGSRSVSDSAPLTAASTEVTLTLPLNEATVIASASDLIGNQSIAASFMAVYNNETLSSCSSAAGGSCRLTIKARRAVDVVASSPGYVSRTGIETLASDEEREVTFKLISEAALKDTYIEFEGFFSAIGQRVSSMHLGSKYDARFYVVSKEAKSTGIFVKIADANAADAAITGVYPPAASVLGSMTATNNPSAITCSDASPCNWADASYYGAINRIVDFEITVSPSAAIDATTHQATLDLKYRAYTVKNNDTYVRDPFDDGLGTAPDSPLPSGYNAAAYKESALLMTPSTTCQNWGCVTMELQQGATVGPNQGFAAKGMMNLVQGEAGFEPLVISYKVELFKDLGDSSKLTFKADPLAIKVINASVPIEDYTGKPRGGDEYCNTANPTWLDIGTNTFTLDLSMLKYCTDYAPHSETNMSYKFYGTIYAKPLNPSNRTDINLTFYTSNTAGTSAGAEETKHVAWISIDNPNAAYSDYASVEMQLSQPNNSAAANADPFEVTTITDCSDMAVQNGTCHNGFLEIKFAITAKRARDVNSIVLRTVPSHVRVIGASLVKGGQTIYPTVYEQGINQDVGHMDEGETITGVAYARPVANDVYSEITLQHKAIDENGAHVTEVKRNVYLSLIPSQLPTNLQPYFSNALDNCFGRVNVLYHSQYSADARLTIADNCSSVAMRISPIYPFDAIPVSVDAKDTVLLARLRADDGSSNCFESCKADGTSCKQGFDALTKQGNGTLRFNTLSAKCPDKFKSFGNRAKYAEVTIGISVGGNIQNEKNITIRVFPDNRYKSVYIAPVLTSYYIQSANLAGNEIFSPQMWTIVNHMQGGKRTFYVVEGASNEDFKVFHGLNPYFKVEFNGPGSKTFAYYRAPGKRMIVYEQLTNSEPIYVSDMPAESAKYFVNDVSEYLESWGELCARPDADCNNDYEVYLTCLANNNQQYSDAYDACMQLTPSENPKQCIAAAEDAYQKGMVTCSNAEGVTPPKGPGVKEPTAVDKSDLLKGNAPYRFDVLQRFVDRGRERAAATAFWRSNKITYWCLSGHEDEWNMDDWNICRPTLDDWRNMTSVDMNQSHPCVFCNNSYTGGQSCNSPLFNASAYFRCTYNDKIPVYQCDQRCVKTAAGGAAPVLYGQNFLGNNTRCLTQLGDYWIYDGSAPFATITTQQISNCPSASMATGTDNGCGIELRDSSPLCFLDGNNDGYFTDETEWTAATKSGSTYSCAGGRVIAVNKRHCNSFPTGYGAKCELDGYPNMGTLTTPSISAVSTLTENQTWDCMAGKSARWCPLVFEPTNNYPYCFKDVNGDNLYDGQVDVDAYGKPTLLPSIYNNVTKKFTCPNNAPLIAVQKRCFVPCENWCLPTDACDINCGPDGIYNTTLNVSEVQNGWDYGAGEPSEKLAQVAFGFNATSPEYAKHILQPMKSFPDMGEPKFSYSTPMNTFGKVSSLYGDLNTLNAMRIARVKGCTIQDSEKYTNYDEEGIYSMTITNNPDLGTGQDVWSGEAKVLTLKKTDYLGAQCRKPDAKWASTELCGLTYSDYSPKYGACINSIYQFGNAYTYNLVGRGKDSVIEPPPMWRVYLGGNTEERKAVLNMLGQVDKGDDITTSIKECFITPRGYYVCNKGQKVEQQVFGIWRPDGNETQRIVLCEKCQMKEKTGEGAWLASRVAGALIGAYGGTVLGNVIGGGGGNIWNPFDWNPLNIGVKASSATGSELLFDETPPTQPPSSTTGTTGSGETTPATSGQSSNVVGTVPKPAGMTWWQALGLETAGGAASGWLIGSSFGKGGGETGALIGTVGGAVLGSTVMEKQSLLGLETGAAAGWYIGGLLNSWLGGNAPVKPDMSTCKNTDNKGDTRMTYNDDYRGINNADFVIVPCRGTLQGKPVKNSWASLYKWQMNVVEKPIMYVTESPTPTAS